MKRLDKMSQSGMSLVEMMMSVACGSLVLAAVITAGVALQRSFMAVEGYSISQGDQLRVLDYIAMDCRRAVSATVVNNVLTVTVPSYYNVDGSPKDPSFNATGALQYGVGTVAISYYQSGSNFMRQVNGVERPIATNVSSFTVTPQDVTSSLNCSITFAPRFTNLPGPGPIAGTTVYSSTFLRNAAARQ
ncbi:MAG: hypothetical protein DMF06_02860 [Verrucomicrobia bacterium]|nr:MAG: hypothetical protein DMF06_02860 [Verrucomicrobiota bacterium]